MQSLTEILISTYTLNRMKATLYTKKRTMIAAIYTPCSKCVSPWLQNRQFLEFIEPQKA